MKKKNKSLEVPPQTQAQMTLDQLQLASLGQELTNMWQKSTEKSIPTSNELMLWAITELKQLKIQVNNRNSSDFCVFIPVLLAKDIEIKILLDNTGQVTSEVLVKGEVTKEVKLKDHTDLPILAQMANLESTKIQLQKPGYRG